MGWLAYTGDLIHDNKSTIWEIITMYTLDDKQGVLYWEQDQH